MNKAVLRYSDDTQIMAEALTCRRGGRTVFANMSFTLSAGSYLCLRGRNGAGKSTLLRLIAGLVPQSDGKFVVQAGGQALDIKSSLLMVGHLNGLKPALTLRDNAAMFQKVMTGQNLDQAVLQAAAKRFALAHLLDQPVQYFSSGQRHRSALMRFELVSRQIWLMDEPTVGLDSDNRQALAVMMQSHLERGGIIISATHDPIDVEGIELNLDDFAPKQIGQNSLESEWL
ncbi:heme ABC exporter ATP-binding protein CcmA [Kordiimonas aquimaris]|uniref:heme ABC exporter ATP-binding protein CcmA n=1 Tax=Kordiimonas aquimaris TaxID=707591 RepID=UPI0021D33966|nr:heme ABC exporter ATP-binding protein CcmA [Kordiimonas aquimaris]